MSEPTVNKNLTVEPATEPQMVRCPKCGGTGLYSPSGRGSDGFEPCPACVPVEPAAPKDKGIKLPFQGQYICPPNKPTDMSCKDINNKGCSKCIYDWLNDEANRQHNELCKELKEENKRLRGMLMSLVEPVENICDISNNSEGITGWHMNGAILLWEQVDCIAELSDKLKELKCFQQQAEEAGK